MRDRVADNAEQLSVVADASKTELAKQSSGRKLAWSDPVAGVCPAVSHACGEDARRHTRLSHRQEDVTVHTVRISEIGPRRETHQRQHVVETFRFDRDL